MLNEKRYEVNTKIFKVFDGVEYKGSVTGYNTQTKLYHIEYEDGDMEDMYHNEVKAHHHANVKRLPKKKRYKKKNNIAATNFVKQYAPTEMEYEEHVLSLSTADIRAIASLRHEDVDLSEEAIPTEMI